MKREWAYSNAKTDDRAKIGKMLKGLTENEFAEMYNSWDEWLEAGGDGAIATKILKRVNLTLAEFTVYFC